MNKPSDEDVGGAITAQDRGVEADPVQIFQADTTSRDFEALYEDLAVSQEYDLQEMDSFLNSLQQIPSNLEPFSSYQYLYQYEHDDNLTQNLQRDVSGNGARHDPHHVQRIVYKSLEQHPEALRVYMEGKI